MDGLIPNCSIDYFAVGGGHQPIADSAGGCPHPPATIWNAPLWISFLMVYPALLRSGILYFFVE